MIQSECSFCETEQNLTANKKSILETESSNSSKYIPPIVESRDLSESDGSFVLVKKLNEFEIV